MNFNELLQLERWLELGFQGILREVAPNTYLSRSNEVAKSPRIDLKVMVGPVHGQRILLTSGLEMLNAWSGSLATTCSTNRSVEDRSAVHNGLIGDMRARLQRFLVIPQWPTYCEPVHLMDIREDGTDDSVVDDQDTDRTAINWQILFSLNPDSIPSNI